MQTILLIGGFGFLGTNIIKYIDEYLFDQYRVIVFDKFLEHMHHIQFKSILKTYAGDFSDVLLVNDILKNNKIDLVIHALSTTVPTSSFNARYDIESNLIPSVELLNGMIANNIYDIVYISSGGAIYGNSSINVKHNETENVSPISSYGVVKLAIEKYLLQYASLYNLRPLILRLSNPYGSYHFSANQGVINIAMAKALRGEVMPIWGDGEGKKDYIYVDDFVTILMLLLKKGVHSEVINLGSGELLSVNQIVKSIAQIVPQFNSEHVDAQQFDVSHFELDLSKLNHLIGDFRYTSLRDGLQKTYNWTKLLCC